MKKLVTSTMVIMLVLSLSGCAAPNNDPVAAMEEPTDTVIKAVENVMPLASVAEEEIIPVSLENEDEAIYVYSVAVDDIIELGGYEWRIIALKGVQALIVSEKVLFKMPYQTAPEGYEFVTLPITWEECELRQYLNGEFYDTNFSAEEKELISETKLLNNDNPWNATAGGNDTLDKVFLLSLDEILEYYGDSGEIENWHGYETFMNDQFNEKRITTTLDDQVSWWWTRSPGAYWYQCDTFHIVAASIMANGGLGIQGEYVTNQYGGVRPAMWLTLRLGL